MNTKVFLINGKPVELYVDDQGRPFIAMAKKRPPLAGVGEAGTDPTDKQFQDGAGFNFEDGPEYQFQSS